MVESGFVQAAVIVLGLGGLVIVCSLFKSRPRPEALTADQLGEIRIRRELAKEATLEEKARRLHDRARIHRHNRLVLTARKDTHRLLHSAQEQWDAKGRTLFNLPKEEIDSVREEASKLLRAGWSESGNSSLPTPPGRFQQTAAAPSAHGSPLRGAMSPLIMQGASERDHRAMTASARRGPSSSHPCPGAPYVDTRFVQAPSQPLVPQLDFTRLHSGAGTVPARPDMKEESRRQETLSNNGQQQLERWQRVKGFYHRNDGPTPDAAFSRSGTGDQGSLVRRTEVSTAWFQEPGLSHPKPPGVPAPTVKTAGGEEESGEDKVSDRLRNLAAGSNFGRVVPMDLFV